MVYFHFESRIKTFVFLALFAVSLGRIAQAHDADAPYRQANRPIEERVADLLSRMTLEEKAAQM